MKKIISILFVAIFAIAILSGCGSSTNATSTSGTKADLLSKSYAEMMKNGKYFIHYKAKITVSGQTTDVESTLATDGKSTSISAVTGAVSTHMIMKDNTIYMLNDKNLTYYKMAIPEAGSSQTNLSTNTNTIETSGLTYMGKGKATLNGKEMNYEEYKTDEGTLRYYFDGSKIYAIGVKSGESEIVMEIIEISDKVTANMVTIPSNYTEKSLN